MSKGGKKDSAELDTSALPPLPKGWCWGTIEQVASYESNSLAIGPFGSNLKVSDYTDSGVPLVFVRNIRSEKFAENEDRYVSPAKADELRAHWVLPGDLLVTKMGDPPGDCCLYPLDRPPAVITADCIKIGLSRAAGYANFFLYAVRSELVHTQILAITRGVAQQKVSLGRFRAVFLPVAPLPEQHRIVAKIEELFSDLDAGVAALQRAKAKLKRYRAAVLKAAVEGRLTEAWRKKHRPKETGQQLLDRILRQRRLKWEEDQSAAYAKAGKTPPANWKQKYKEPAHPDTSNLPELPECWCWATLEQVNLAERPMSYGVLQPGEDLPEGVPLVRVCDVADGKIAIGQLKRISPAIADRYRRTLLEGGELLLTIVGTIGRTAIVPECLRGANTARAVAVIPMSPLLSGHYIELAMRESGMRSRLTLTAHEVARKTLNLEDVRVTCIPLAPLTEQDQIVAEVERRLSIAEDVEVQIAANLTRSTRLRQSILKRAFEGKLVPQDPKDEPASVLLDRVRAQRSNGDDPSAEAAPSEKPRKRGSRQRGWEGDGNA